VGVQQGVEIVASTRNDYKRAHAARESTLGALSVISLLVGSFAIMLALYVPTRPVAWIAALLAVSLGTVCVGMRVQRSGLASAGILLGGLAFAFSFAMVTWGG
jgi:hypothetical protein